MDRFSVVGERLATDWMACCSNPGNGETGPGPTQPAGQCVPGFFPGWGVTQRPGRDVDHPAHLTPRLSMVGTIALLPLCSPNGMLPVDLYLYSPSKNFSNKIFNFLRLSHDPLRGYIHKLEVRAS